MQHLNLKEIINDHSDVNSYILFREMEDWCCENLTDWRLDYSTAMCVYGVDIPSKIIFKRIADVTAFKSRFAIK